jgi:hypothetical protein
MSTTIVRIPVPQELWTAVRATASTHLQALIDYERTCTLYAADPSNDLTTMQGRQKSLDYHADAVGRTRTAMQAAIAALAKAEVEHVMGPKS